MGIQNENRSVPFTESVPIISLHLELTPLLYNISPDAALFGRKKLFGSAAKPAQRPKMLRLLVKSM